MRAPEELGSMITVPSLVPLSTSSWAVALSSSVKRPAMAWIAESVAANAVTSRWARLRKAVQDQELQVDVLGHQGGDQDLW